MIRHIHEYRQPDLVKKLIHQIDKAVTRDWYIMEICGGQTHSLVKNGILDILPRQVNMIHGPGCPVCVTPQSIIDLAIELATRKDVVLCTYGDMVRVPGNNGSLLSAKARGGHVKICYSPLEAVQWAKSNPEKEIVFLAVGFETTSPAHALALSQARNLGLPNFSMLQSHVLVPPAMKAILDDPNHIINGFLAAGHVCAISGMHDYYEIAKNYKVPIVATGFEPVDLLWGILKCVEMLEKNQFEVTNQYGRAVDLSGNQAAQQISTEVFELSDKEWRGLGCIPNSGLKIKTSYEAYDAFKKFNLSPKKEEESKCEAGLVLKGLKKPNECPFFGHACTPEQPMGAPMVSSEGACAAYYHYHYQSITT
jgi:hydrogenase expression/formation protein HypD